MFPFDFSYLIIKRELIINRKNEVIKLENETRLFFIFLPVGRGKE